MKRFQLFITFSLLFLFSQTDMLFADNVYVLNLQDENHYFEIADNDDNDLDLGSVYTIEAWIYVKDASHGNERIFRSQGWQIYVVSGTGSGGANATIRIDGSFMPAGSIDMSVPTEEWHHICLMSDGTGWTNNYLDGVALQNGGSSDISGSSNLRIGSYSLESTDFIGAIDEVRISNINRYSRWSFTVTKDDPPFTDDANTILLYHFDDNTEFPPGNSSSKVFSVTNYGVDAGDYFDWDDPSFSEPLPLGNPSAIKNTPSPVAEKFELYQNYPNPFNPTTNISFQLPQASQVSLIVYDMNGRKVADLASDFYSAGRHVVSFDASNLSSGVYIYSLRAGNMLLNRKMMLSK